MARSSAPKPDISLGSWIRDAARSIRGVGTSYGYLIRTFAEGGGHSAGEHDTTPAVRPI